ncbi:hypothetical protein LJR219_004498 [Phenylobacterium sp. LjRoot219]|uniref:hypothetical protein n=1 Tax=Phenylobacterium sp. LjRoot219 TaxID=3342283 RepID=UPI003ECC72AC
MSAFRYGIFKLGQIWTVTDNDGARLGFPSREVAMAAICAIVSIHRACRETVLVTVQDEHGGLRTVLDPIDDYVLEGAANDERWDALLGAPPPAATLGQPHAAEPWRWFTDVQDRSNEL